LARLNPAARHGVKSRAMAARRFTPPHAATDGQSARAGGSRGSVQLWPL
jgi:hypothetical protein